MSKETIHRTFSDILIACQTSKCETPFFTLPFKFERVDKTSTILKIEEGQTITVKETQKNGEEEDDEKVEFDRTIKVTNKRDISCDENDEKRNNILEIADYLLRALKAMFGTATISINCEFGIQKETNNIYLLESSSAESLKDGFVSSLLEDVPNGESEFQNFMQCAISPEFFEPPCKKPIHKARKIDVIYYRAHMKFPTVNEYRLYKVIKHRLEEMAPQLLNETVNVCLKCSLNYTGARRETKGSKLTNSMFRENDPHTFEALTPLEMERRRTIPTGYTQDMHKAYCFTVNLRESPYHEKPLSIQMPPKERTKPTVKREIVPSNEDWVLRLTGEKQEPAKVVDIPQEINKKVEEPVYYEEKPLPPTYSQKLAPKAYTNQTFKYGFIDKKKNGRVSTSSLKKTSGKHPVKTSNKQEQIKQKEEEEQKDEEVKNEEQNKNPQENEETKKDE